MIERFQPALHFGPIPPEMWRRVSGIGRLVKGFRWPIGKTHPVQNGILLESCQNGPQRLERVTSILHSGTGQHDVKGMEWVVKELVFPEGAVRTDQACVGDHVLREVSSAVSQLGKGAFPYPRESPDGAAGSWGLAPFRQGGAASVHPQLPSMPRC